MKKILFFSAAAAMMLASCSSEETVQAPKGNAIDFGNAFVNNSTRAEDLTTANIQNFDVWGYMTSLSGVIFNGEVVTKGTSVAGGTSGWSYTNVQFWTPNQPYWFAAIAPSKAATFAAPTAFPTNGDGAGTITFTNTKGDTDLCADYLYQGALASGHPIQAFSFNHLLSRVKFTFTNGLAAAGSNIKISDLQINKTNTAGTYNCADKTWTAANEGNDVVFAYKENIDNADKSETVESQPMYLIPGAASVNYNVSFTVTETLGDFTKTYTHTVTISQVALEQGKSYNFTAEINDANIDPENERKPIEFSATVGDWTDATDVPALNL